jgi:UDP-glucose 4-epimerase
VQIRVDCRGRSSPVRLKARVIPSDPKFASARSAGASSEDRDLKVLVTGGAGYVGSHAVKRLLRGGHEVVVYDDLSRGHAASVPADTLVRGELADGAGLAALLSEREIDAVMHFAAYALVGESVADPALYYRNNVAGTVSLLEAMRKADVHRIVVSSTCATYGEPDVIPIREDTPQHPVNPYGFTKLVMERALADYAHAYGFAYATLRYFNACGASPDGDLGEDHDPETHAIPLALLAALGRRERFTIFGDDYPTPDGTCIRDYVHVDDLAEAHALALDRLESGQGLRLNLGTGRGFSVREVVDSCRRVSGREFPVTIGPRRPGDPPELVADPSAARDVLGWTAKYTELDPIVETAWRWHSRDASD